MIESRQQELAEVEARDSGGTIRKALFVDVPGAVGSFQCFAQCAQTEPDEFPHG